MHAFSNITFSRAPDLAPLIYAPANDNLHVRFHEGGGYAHAVSFHLTGPEEQARFLASLDTIAAELRRRLASTASSQPSPHSTHT